MTIELKPEQEQLVEDALRSGAYRSKEDVIERALAVLHEQDEWLTLNRSDVDARIRNGIAQLDWTTMQLQCPFKSGYRLASSSHDRCRRSLACRGS